MKPIVNEINELLANQHSIPNNDTSSTYLIFIDTRSTSGLQSTQ